MKKLIYFSFIIILAVSCAPAYTPNIVNTPLLSNEGEFQAAVGTGTSGIDPQIAYAITDQIGIMANASFANRRDSSNFHKHSFAEAGLGYFLTIAKRGRFEVYGGAGYGTVDAMYRQDIFYGRSHAKLTRIFIQPSIGLSSDVFEGAFTPRIVFLNINNYSNVLHSSSFEPFIEPTFTAKVGWRYVKMMFQVGLSLPLTELRTYSNQPFMFSIGLVGKIPGKKKTTTELTE